MILKIVYFTLLNFLMVKCESPPNLNYGPPISSYGTPNYNAHHHDQEYNAPKSYEFGYQVKDDYSGNNYKRQEASDGNQVQGEYRVQLPDGRTQIVTYYADWQTGFHADVRYEGEAVYPENYNGYPHGPQNQNSYGPPAPSYHGGGNQYNHNTYNSPATSSVSIKDYSGPGSPYNPGGGYGGYGNHGHQGYNGGYDGGYGDNYGNKVLRPPAVYGAP